MKGVAAVVLAAGLGKRMKSALPKVSHPVLGRPMLARVAEAVRAAGISEMVFVLGHGRDRLLPVAEEFGAKVALQDRQLGTGDAARCGLELLSPGCREVVVLCGDAVLVRPASIRSLLSVRRRKDAYAAVLTGLLEDPRGYGRIVRDPKGFVARIVEERDADAATKALREVNSGSYAFDRAFLARALPRITDFNTQRELYLTDTVTLALEEGNRVVAVPSSHPDEVRGINSRSELAEVSSLLLRAVTDGHMASGVTFLSPGSAWVEPEVKIAADAVIGPAVVLRGKTRIGAGVRIDAGCVVDDSVVEEGSVLKAYSVLSGSRVRKNSVIGPFAHLRPGADVGEEAHVGNFVEVKKSRIGRGSKANHLAYVGDAEVGRNVNIGAGTITCNYDGTAKHRTVISDGVFIGSDTQLVAPVSVGKGALVAAGTTVTDDVPPFALVLSRAPQKTIEGWVAKKRPELLEKAGIAPPKGTRDGGSGRPGKKNG
jgi:bifunctional UDP-N-acetylglucosamine pyrophosphorylase/glucosamine-1-phosphate N-acetyltransferase